MSKVFFSYAHEDARTVDGVYRAVAARFPQHAPWMDKYEIVGGESLIGKIADGMDAAHKFLVFLSPVAVTKPWVQRELRRALVREIQGVDPAFIIPVRLRDLDSMPPFLEDKFYIDLAGWKEDQWLAAIDAAITGRPPRPSGGQVPNVRADVSYDPAGRHVALVAFHAVGWAESFSVAVKTNADIVHATEIAEFALEQQTGPDYHREPRYFGFRCESPVLLPGKPPFRLQIEFAPNVDALEAIADVVPWKVAST